MPSTSVANTKQKRTINRKERFGKNRILGINGIRRWKPQIEIRSNKEQSAFLWKELLGL